MYLGTSIINSDDTWVILTTLLCQLRWSRLVWNVYSEIQVVTINILNTQQKYIQLSTFLMASQIAQILPTHTFANGFFFDIKGHFRLENIICCNFICCKIYNNHNHECCRNILYFLLRIHLCQHRDPLANIYGFKCWFSFFFQYKLNKEMSIFFRRTIT